MGHTLVDATTPSASVLIINPNAEEVVLPCGSYIGDLVPVLAVSVARSDLQLPVKVTTVLPDHLEDIVKGSHTSLGDTGRQSLRAYVHCLIPKIAQTGLTPLDNIDDSGAMATGFTFNDDCGYLGVGRAGSIPLCIRKTGRIWPVIVSSLCTVEDWLADIF